MLSGLLVMILFLLLVQVDQIYFHNPTKAPFRDLAQYVHATEQNGDYLLNWNSSSHHLWESKYYGLDAPFFVGTAQMTDADIVHDVPPGTTRVGVITSGGIEEITVPGYKPIETKTFGDLRFVWLIKPAQNLK